MDRFMLLLTSISHFWQVKTAADSCSSVEEKIIVGKLVRVLKVICVPFSIWLFQSKLVYLYFRFWQMLKNINSRILTLFWPAFSSNLNGWGGGAIWPYPLKTPKLWNFQNFKMSHIFYVYNQYACKKLGSRDLKPS